MPMRRCCAAQRERVRERSAAQSSGRRAARLILAHADVLSCCRAYTHARTHSRTHARTDRRTCTHTQATHKHTSTNCAHSIRHAHARARNRCAPAQTHSCVTEGRCAAAHALPAKDGSAARYGYSIDSVYCEERCPHCQLPEWPNLQRLPLVLRRRLARLRLPIPSRTMPRGVQHATDSVQPRASLGTACNGQRAASRMPRLTNACRTPIAVGVAHAVLDALKVCAEALKGIATGLGVLCRPW